MAVRTRSLVAVGLFVLLAAGVAAGRWHETHRVQPQRVAEKDILLHVTNGGDRGPGTLREALFIAAAATSPTTISLEVPVITLQTALPGLVNGRGVRIVGQAAGAQIDAQALASGPVLDVSGPATAIEGITIRNCPGAAILVRTVHFRLSGSTIDACDVGVEVAENTGETLIERNHFQNDRIGVRFGASGRNSTVAQNEFTRDKDAGFWAVRGTPDSRDEVINIHDNKFTEDGAGIVTGNIPVLAEKNDFINDREAAVHIVGARAVIRGNRVDGGASMGIVVENARGAIIDNNELEGLTAYGVMVRGSSDTLVQSNRLYNCGYGLAFVLGDAHNANTATDNTIIEPKFNGIDVAGDSPVLRRNQVLRAHAFAIHVEDVQPVTGAKVHSQPFLENNNFGESSINRGSASVAARPPAVNGATHESQH
jgi:parallel beta-helix repeat protein